MRLIKAHDYVAARLNLDRQTLARSLPQRSAQVVNMLRQKTLVVADGIRGLRVIATAQILGLTTGTNANTTIAFRRRGADVTVAEYYRQRREYLLWPQLPVLVVGNPAGIHREFFPLERVHLHDCERPCRCPTFGAPHRPRAPVPTTRALAPPATGRSTAPPAWRLPGPSQPARSPKANFAAISESIRHKDSAKKEQRRHLDSEVRRVLQRFIDESDLEAESEHNYYGPPSESSEDEHNAPGTSGCVN